jgi:hypothetical protein
MARSQGWLCCSACNPSCQPHARAYALSSLVRELGARSWLWQLYELDGKSEHQHFAASQLVIIHLRRHFGTLATFTVKMAVESCSRPVVGSPESRVLCVVCTSQTQWRGTCTLLLSCLVCYYASPIGRQDSDHVAYLRALCVVYLYGTVFGTPVDPGKTCPHQLIGKTRKTPLLSDFFCGQLSTFWLWGRR